MYLIAFPLLLIPFALFNMVAFLLGMSFGDTVFNIPLLEGRQLAVTTGDLLVALGMLLLYLEVLKAARPGTKAVMDHVLSLILFIAMASELVLVPPAATSTLLLLAVLAFVDVIAGLSLARQPKPHEIVIEGADRTRV
jgi:hypothetical protein